MGSSPANPTTVQALTKVSAFLFPSKGEREIFRRYCGLDAEGEIDPIPGVGGFSPWEGGCLFAAVWGWLRA